MTPEQHAIETVDRWRVVDKWWTSEPEERYWITLRAPNGATAAVCYLGGNSWEIRAEHGERV